MQRPTQYLVWLTRRGRCCRGCSLGLIQALTSPSPCPGRCAGMLLRACSALHLGSGDPGCRAELHHDGNLFRPVCHGGMCWLTPGDGTAASAVSPTSPHFSLLPPALTQPPRFLPGIPESQVVTLCPSDSDALYCHHPHAACCCLPRCGAPDGDE